jgi:hypothetical protein
MIDGCGTLGHIATATVSQGAISQRFYRVSAGMHVAKHEEAVIRECNEFRCHKS